MWGFSFPENTVYLTFDDGPNKGITDWILNFLKEKSIQATFFCVGENVRQNSELIERIRKEGHALGGHTMRHEKSTKTAWTKYKKSVIECQDLVQSKLFRPPYGRLSMRRATEISKDYKIIMWTWLSYDFDEKVSVESIVQNAKKQIKAGDILLLHDNQKMTSKVKMLLPKLIEVIEKKGFKFAVLDASLILQK
ncbi:MAG: polysaccharide deacetylase family protein [Bacteroidetes bacterium]|nr:polysaccharide deacetylase family protein [Bacteroidota bacterium]